MQMASTLSLCPVLSECIAETMASSQQTTALTMTEAKPFVGPKLPFTCSLSSRPKPLCAVGVRAATAVASKITLRRPILEPPFLLADMRTNLMHNMTKALEDANGRFSWSQPQVIARVSASLDSDEEKTDGARKALEQMFKGRTDIGKKLEVEIKKRELGGSDGSGRGSGGGGGGGRRWGAGDDDMDEDFGGQDEPWDWEEVGQTFMATFALIILYFSITHGPKQVFRLFKLFFRWVRQGFTLRAIPWEYLEPGPDDVLTEDEEEEIAMQFDEDKILRREVDDTPQQSNGRDNYNKAEESEDEDFDLPAPPIQKKENRMAAMQAQQKEKMLQMLTKDRREKGRRE